jgi:hypothetical protein
LQFQATILSNKMEAKQKFDILKKEENTPPETGKSLYGCNALLRRAKADRHRMKELLNMKFMYVCLERLNVFNFRRFKAMVEYQWAWHLDPRPSKHMDIPWVYTEKETRLLNFFERNADAYYNNAEFGEAYSDQIRQTLPFLPKETRQWVRAYYRECWKCGCFVHKSMVNMVTMSSPTFLELQEENGEEALPRCCCIDCVGESRHALLPRSSSFMVYFYGPIPSHKKEALAAAAENSKGARTVTTKKKRKKKKKKRSKKFVCESNDSVSSLPSSSSSEETSSHTVDRSSMGSPTTVASADTVDWVDFLQETGSILALNDYMDTVLGVGDFNISDDYDDDDNELEWLPVPSEGGPARVDNREIA